MTESGLCGSQPPRPAPKLVPHCPSFHLLLPWPLFYIACCSFCFLFVKMAGSSDTDDATRRNLPRPRSSSISNTKGSSFGTRIRPFPIMHRVFIIQEILSYILEPFRLASKDVQDAKGRNEARHALAALARTSKLFHEPSLNYLWETMPSVVPIVLLLSDSISQVGLRGHAIRRVVSHLFHILLLYH